LGISEARGEGTKKKAKIVGKCIKRWDEHQQTNTLIKTPDRQSLAVNGVVLNDVEIGKMTFHECIRCWVSARARKAKS
jgi:hypothetical protein